jgi:5-formyltetrahydrofolate cyclo-ligase
MKSELRKKMLQLRESMNRKDVLSKSSVIESRLFSIPQFTECRNVLFYASFKNEVETYGMIQKGMDCGKRIYVPLVIKGDRNLLVSEIKSLGELATGAFGIPEPQKEFFRPVRWIDIEVVIVPALAYDLNGFRLGYGGGYYDRLLSGVSPE